MKYSNLVKEFIRANREGQTIEGYITFTQDSFDKSYPLQARTYLVSSDNKAFKSGMSSNSIFGSALDGSDNGVRLDLYMRETGNKDGWVVEDCGLVYYQLLETCDRSMAAKGIFFSQANAHNAMLKAIKATFGDDVNECMEQGFGGIKQSNAWATETGENHHDYDWNIIRLFGNGFLLRGEPEMNEPKEA